MLRFDKLEVSNFGPFKGTQVIDFSEKDGVTIIWGNNGRGKTKLLNVFRYALFGKIKTRHGTSIDYMNICNTEAQKDGIYGFSVSLYMSNDGDHYILRRSVRPRIGVSVPMSNEDFMEDCALKKNSQILSPSDRDHELNQIMPQDISRFFLFDGELLQEYETLLDDNSDDGKTIKASIEKILGMPILTNGKVDIGLLVSEYVTAKNKAAQDDENTAALAAAINNVIVEINGHNSEIERLKQLAADENEALTAVEKRMADTEKIRGLLEKQKAESSALESLTKQRDDIVASLQAEMHNAWQDMVAGCVRDTVEALQMQMSEYNTKHSVVVASQSVLTEIEKAIANHCCGICGQEISESVIDSLKRKVESIRNSTPLVTEEEERQYASLRAQLSQLRSIKLESNGKVILEKQRMIDNLGIQIGDAQQKLNGTKAEINSYGSYDPNVIDLLTEHSLHQSKIKELKDGISAENAALAVAEGKRKQLDSKITASSTSKDVKKAGQRLEIAQQLEQIFAEAIMKYSMQLKHSVEADASDLFTRMSSDKDYVKLEINDNYGLRIIHKSGIAVPERSAGFEHVVALALIGALHMNAPLQGPVIMDSPFGRLDPIHKRNITENLPRLSNQVILLAYTDEIDADMAREYLGGYLSKEYRLEKVSSFHTQIE